MSSFTLPNYSEIGRDVLIERIIQIEQNEGLRFQTHPRFGMTAAEDALLGILASRKEVVTKEGAYTLMYGMADDPPMLKILDVMICKLRRKLRPHNITIHTVWGRGWYLDPEDRQKVHAMRLPEIA